MNATKRATPIFSDTTHDARSAESLRFEQLRHDVCWEKPFIPLRVLLSGRFAEFLPSMSIIEPNLAEMKLPVTMTGERLAEVSARDLPDNDYLNLVRPDVREFAYRTSVAMIERPCGLWERLMAGLTDSTSYAFEITGFPVIDEARQARQLAFLVRYAPAPETVRAVAGVSEGVEGHWLDLGHGVPEEGPIGFL
jgi:hypothetical protein